MEIQRKKHWQRSSAYYWLTAGGFLAFVWGWCLHHLDIVFTPPIWMLFFYGCVGGALLMLLYAIPAHFFPQDENWCIVFMGVCVVVLGIGVFLLFPVIAAAVISIVACLSFLGSHKYFNLIVPKEGA